MSHSWCSRKTVKKMTEEVFKQNLKVGETGEGGWNRSCELIVVEGSAKGNKTSDQMMVMSKMVFSDSS